VNDPVARLQKRIGRGEVKLGYDPEHEYLKSVFENLGIRVNSQTLVFSKTSFQYKHISAASFITGPQSPIKDRWGGWYVTGPHGTQTYMGNVVVTDRDHPENIDRKAGSNLTDLLKLFDTSRYLTGTSDIVAHLVLAHQTQMHNLITLTNYQRESICYFFNSAASSKKWNVLVRA
jgi:hypothetical protein